MELSFLFVNIVFIDDSVLFASQSRFAPFYSFFSYFFVKTFERNEQWEEPAAEKRSKDGEKEKKKK